MKDEKISGLLNHREKLLAYIRKKMPDSEIAEDVLQDSLLKALKNAKDLRDEEKLIPWFYRILNNAIIDFYRSRQNNIKQYDISSIEIEGSDEATEEESVLCECFRELIPTLKPEYARLIDELDLSDGNPEAVSERLGITRNNLKVRRYRARQALRQKLEETCRLCSKHGCLDCTCRKK